MAAPERRSSTGVGRRASSRLSRQHDTVSDDEDDQDLAAMGISDGFRPAHLSHNRVSSQASQHDRPLGRRTPPPIPPPRPSSTTKPRLESFALRHDGAMGPIAPRNAVTAFSSNGALSRPSSVSTDIPLRAESPYTGPSGPSHPYQMYPQESRLARTASIATTSTLPLQERSYAGPNGPTHPYGMYPQNTVPEGETVHDAIAPVPVGFPGLNNNYQRRLGPEGEEIADIIGPDGHTEQLPPYTKYPDDALARKTRPVVVVPPPGAGGIGLATQNPEFSSHEDLSSPRSIQSAGSLVSDSSPQLTSGAPVLSEKPTLNKWQRAAHKKICGVFPLWALILATFVLMIFAIVMGVSYAVIKEKRHDKHLHPVPASATSTTPYPTSMTTTYDANHFTAVPTGIPQLPTGTYALPISAPSTIQNSCIVDTADSGAWSCTIEEGLPYQVTVSALPGTIPLADNGILLSYGNATPGFLAYGAQPPLTSQEQILSLVTDNQDPERGPAWFFQSVYNKLVVLPESALTASTNSKRNPLPQEGYPISGFTRKGVAQPGDMPWFCYWNGTLLETFLYVNQSSSQAAQSGTIPSSTSQATATSSAGSQQTYHPQSPYYGGYPTVIKVEERRVPQIHGMIPPYCVQHIVNSDGSYEPALNSTNQPITIALNETEPETISPLSDRGLFEGGRAQLLSERQSDSSCGCVWIYA